MVINQEAPVVQKKEILIHSTPENVWSILTGIENWNQWNPKIKTPKLESALKVGTHFTWKTNGSNIRSSVHTFQPNEFLGWTGKAIGARAIHNWFLTVEEGGTMVRVEESMDGWLVNLLKGKMNQILADDLGFWLECLKNEVEGG